MNTFFEVSSTRATRSIRCQVLRRGSLPKQMTAAAHVRLNYANKQRLYYIFEIFNFIINKKYRKRKNPFFSVLNPTLARCIHRTDVEIHTRFEIKSWIISVRFLRNFLFLFLFESIELNLYLRIGDNKCIQMHSCKEKL